MSCSCSQETHHTHNSRSSAGLQQPELLQEPSYVSWWGPVPSAHVWSGRLPAGPSSPAQLTQLTRWKWSPHMDLWVCLVCWSVLVGPAHTLLARLSKRGREGKKRECVCCNKFKKMNVLGDTMLFIISLRLSRRYYLTRYHK